MDPAKVGVIAESAIKGGEAEALKRLEEYKKDKAYLATFAKPKTSPSTDFANPSTTLMSPYLKFGCIGIRKLWYDVKQAVKEAKGTSKTNIPENYEGQLLFREMYAACDYAVGGEAFGRVQDNKICRYVSLARGVKPWLPRSLFHTADGLVPADAVRQGRPSHRAAAKGRPRLGRAASQVQGWADRLPLDRELSLSWDERPHTDTLFALCRTRSCAA